MPARLAIVFMLGIEHDFSDWAHYSGFVNNLMVNVDAQAGKLDYTNLQ